MMMVFFAILSAVFNVPVLIGLLSIVFFASIGISLGVRRVYIKVLLQIFEYGRQNIENVRKKTHPLINRLDSEDERNVSGTADDTSDTVDGITTSKDQSFDPSGEFKKPLPPAELKPAKRKSHKKHNSNGNTVISRDDALILVPHGVQNTDGFTFVRTPRGSDNENSDTETDHPVDFHLATCLGYIRSGVEAIIEDEVTSRFEAEELKNWNLLTRTNRYHEFISWRLSIIWFIGFFIRYFILMPFRVIICFVGVLWLTICTAAVGFLPDGDTKRKMVHNVLIHCFVFLSSALSAVINYHDIQNRPGKTGICVANHTSPIDVLVLMCDNCYSLIGQRHGGFLGLLQRALARASPHIWFERAESKDRMAVAQRLRQHVSDPNNPPILIFPEGTCINNTSVMQFKKGSFEVGGVIYPVAIKYDPRFGDPFWNSSKYSMMQYLFLMMTSWAIVCDVWYLPPMYQQEDESAIVFANRVKGVIAEQGGLVDLSWDGNLKRNKPKDEWKEKQQEEFTKRLKGES
ncbi:glycerol-3-phosphate acyltransferase 3 isoform X1 [Sitodiplosis mosellana]|uniref:glycerol-3-phosphate acyltransferase 3 isoform X1 n=2 Tax=Sitodiplosis mosellana TaxID=263140 RepID=UPI002443AEED|nr:glycerol-3-phosphate acyltransferase 3 isoform X1 [Sitodiplosis mosellana]XP_055314402.1 glycerol-3-phosphate acyltransferase 3 isoform X1 [Sitodiplosis mosellana]XP_055314403.1 glycerol-3-phosphate acyltransferase 3 isoform X1 [Sitodiplosis mosellana]XP_055314404.1 glycerol-3-phosphate acyltransferase 3 isoform X1 [Sitodiplosis mosellana]XP_055314405.1 glycerol-3-phosphate acyltransferase 3 isoform X1 [Sitodiplosis mosellana]